MTRRRTPKALLFLVGGLAAACLLAVPVQSQGPGSSQGLQIGLYKGHEVAVGEVLVRLHENARQAPMAQELDVDRDEQIGDGSIRRIHSRSHNVETLLARLSESGDVEYVEPNYVLHALVEPNDQKFGSLWGMLQIDAPTAWNKTTGNRSNVVGVVDTGIDYSHPDLAANVWSAPSAFTIPIGDFSITCAAGTHGFNAIRKTCDPMDDNGHGTHVSGTIGAEGNNEIGVVGVNWVASIMGLKFLNNRGSGYTSDAVNAIEFAIQAKQIPGLGANVRVLSNSWGGGAKSQALLDEITKADSESMLFVAAAGNNGRNIDQTPSYPASYDAPNVVAVAATDNTDTLASWSNYGVSSVDLAAPGVDIYSTLRNGKYGTMSGTSMATPHVSGAAALVLSVPACSARTPVELKSVLVGYTHHITGLDGKVVTGGRLNVNAAVRNCTIVPSPPPPAPDFSIAAQPPSLSVPRGGTKSYSITISSPNNSFTGAVDLSVSGVPAGATATFGSDPVNGPYPATTTLSVTPGSSTKTWTYNLKITGTSGGLVHSTTVKLSVTR